MCDTQSLEKYAHLGRWRLPLPTAHRCQVRFQRARRMGVCQETDFGPSGTSLRACEMQGCTCRVILVEQAARAPSVVRWALCSIAMPTVSQPLDSEQQTPTQPPGTACWDHLGGPTSPPVPVFAGTVAGEKMLRAGYDDYKHSFWPTLTHGFHHHGHYGEFLFATVKNLSISNWSPTAQVCERNSDLCCNRTKHWLLVDYGLY